MKATKQEHVVCRTSDRVCISLVFMNKKCDAGFEINCAKRNAGKQGTEFSVRLCVVTKEFSLDWLRGVGDVSQQGHIENTTDSGDAGSTINIFLATDSQYLITYEQ